MGFPGDRKHLFNRWYIDTNVMTCLLKLISIVNPDADIIILKYCNQHHT